MSNIEPSALAINAPKRERALVDPFSGFASGGQPFLENLITIGRLVAAGATPPWYGEGLGEFRRHFDSSSGNYRGFVILDESASSDPWIGVQKKDPYSTDIANDVFVRHYLGGRISLSAEGGFLNEATTWDAPIGKDVGTYHDKYHPDLSDDSRFALKKEAQRKKSWWTQYGGRAEISCMVDELGDRTIDFLDRFTNNALTDFLGSYVHTVLHNDPRDRGSGRLVVPVAELDPAKERSRQLKILTNLFAAPLGYSQKEYQARFPDEFPPLHNIASLTSRGDSNPLLAIPGLNLPLLVQPPEGRLSINDIIQIAGIDTKHNYNEELLSTVRDNCKDLPSQPYAIRVDEVGRRSGDLSRNGVLAEAIAYSIAFPKLLIREGLVAWASSAGEYPSIGIPYIAAKAVGSIGNYTIERPQLDFQGPDISESRDWYYQLPPRTRIMVVSKAFLTK